MAGSSKGFKEFVRKRIVALKRKPQTISLVVLALAFLYYSLNLTKISNTTAKIQSPGMGLCGFVTMLFSILCMVCFLNAFPHRKKVNVPMLILMFLMVGAVALTALLPAYSKWIKRINTSVEVEGNGGMGVIDISGED